MTVRLSTGLANNLVGATGFSASFAGGVIDVYTGSQPVSADAGVIGTLLGRVTLSSAAFSPEVPASATLTLSGASGSVDAITIGALNIIPLGAVQFITDLATTAQAVADAITRNGLYTATASGAVVTVKAPSGVGDAHNGLALVATATTMVATSSGNISGGVTAAAGVQFSAPSNGAVSKAGVWSFVGVAAGTAGWFRFKASAADSDLVSTTAVRLDGSVATSGADMNLSNLVIAVNSPNTIDSFTWTQPKA